MTRGRRKDHTVPASRALAQQRDYRARKARYISDLEDRCRRAEEENIQLRKELELTRSGVLPSTTLLNPEAQQVFSDAIQQLGAVSDSLARFHKLAFTNQNSLQTSSPVPTSSPTSLRPAIFPTPGPSFVLQTSPSGYMSDDSTHLQPVIPTAEPPGGSAEGTMPLHDDHTNTPSPSLESECCGGFVDCHDFVDEEEVSEDDHYGSVTLMRMSGMRSTSGEHSRTSLSKLP